MPLITRDDNLLSKHLTDIEITTPNILGLQNQINSLDATRKATPVYIDTVAGDNNNDGLTPDTPIKDLEAASQKFPLIGQWYARIKGSGDPTNKRKVLFSDLYPTVISSSGVNFYGRAITVYDTSTPDVELVLTRNGNGSGIFNWWFSYLAFIDIIRVDLTFEDSIYFVIYGACVRFAVSTVTHNGTYTPIGLLTGMFRTEQVAFVMNTSATFFNLASAGVIDIHGTLTDNYATANGLTARTWTQLTTGIIRNSSGIATNVISNTVQ